MAQSWIQHVTDGTKGRGARCCSVRFNNGRTFILEQAAGVILDKSAAQCARRRAIHGIISVRFRRILRCPLRAARAARACNNLLIRLN